MVRSSKDKRISSLLDSNNKLALELKACDTKIDILQPLIKKIKNQKSDYESSYKGKDFLVDASKVDIHFMESTQLPSKSDIKTQEDVEKLFKLSFRLHSVLSKFHKARERYYNKKLCSDLSTQTDSTPEMQNWLQSSFKTQKTTIQKLENEIKSLKKTISSMTNEARSKNSSSDEWETVATNDSSITESISRELMRSLIVEIHTLKGCKIPAKEFKHLREIYKADFDFIALLQLPKAKNVELTLEKLKELTAIKDKLQAMLAKFVNSNTQSPQIQVDENDNSLSDNGTSRDQCTETTDSLILNSFNKQNVEEIQLFHSEILAQLESKVKSTLNLEIETAIKKSTESFKNLSVKCSECSNLVMRIGELERKLLDKDDLVSEKSRRMSEMETCLNKKVSDGESTISSLNAELQKLETQITEADKELRYETLNKNLALKRVSDLEMKMGTEMKEKEFEISKLKTKVENQAKLYSQQQKSYEASRNQWNKTYQNGCRQVEFLQADNSRLVAQNNHLEMRFRSVCVDASQMENELRITRTTATTARRHQQEANKLKNQLAEEKKKTKDLVACDKPNSEYEMLLSEKDAIIAEYVSVLDSKYLTIDIVDECW